MFTPDPERLHRSSDRMSHQSVVIRARENGQSNYVLELLISAHCLIGHVRIEEESLNFNPAGLVSNTSEGGGAFRFQSRASCIIVEKNHVSLPDDRYDRFVPRRSRR